VSSPSADARVPDFWRALGRPGLIDAHVHFLPPRMMRRVWAHFDAAGTLIGRPWPIVYRWSDEERVRHLSRLGVRAYPALAYAHRPDMARDLNDWTLAFAAANPACVPSATCYPEPVAGSYVDEALRRGARVFKLHLQVGGFDPRDPLLDPVWGSLADAGIAVVVHAGSGPVPNRYTGPGPIGEVLTRHPGLRLVIAHLGAPEYAEFLGLARRFDGVALDTTMVFTGFFEQFGSFPRELLAHLRELGLAGRVVLGSDFPNLPYPYVEQLDALAALDLGDDWLRAVCWDNGAALLGITEPAPER